MTEYSELVLLFDTDNLTYVAGQLGKAFDNFSIEGSRHMPTMIIVRKDVWLALERDLAELFKDRYVSKEDVKKSLSPAAQERIKQYDRVNKKPGIQRPPQHGYNALIFRSRPVVAIDGDNIVAAKVGAI